jgi:prolyl 4-hydroxylase
MAQHPELVRAQALAAAGQVREGVEIVHRLAGTGDPDALFLLADLFWRGEVLEQDMPQARRIFAMAEAAGNAMARRAITNLMARGTAGPRDWQGALARLRSEAPYDDLRGQMWALIQAMELTPEGDPAALPQAGLLSEAPQVKLFPRAFTRAECDYLMRVAEPAFEESYVVDSQGGRMRDPVRTSDGSTMHLLIEDPATHALNRRLAALTGTDEAQGEPLQILRYQPGQEYRRHLDWIVDENPRTMTALVYLNQDYDGGETDFPKAGLRIRGETGDVLMFRNAGPDGRVDPLTEHAGLPVTRGVKFLASRWIRERAHAP